MNKTISALPWIWQDFMWLLFFEAAAFVFFVLSFHFLGNFPGPFFFQNESIQTLVFYLLQTFLLLFPLYVFTVRKHGSDLKDFGWRKVRLRLLIKKVFQGFFLYYLLSFLFVQIMYRYEVEIPGYGEQMSHIPLFGDSLGGIFLAVVVMVGIAPLVEEFFFRGYVYQLFKKYMRLPVASVFSALLFVLFHLEFQVFIPIFFLGVILNWLFESTRSLWTAVAFHMLNNAFAFFLELALYFQWIELPG